MSSVVLLSSLAVNESSAAESSVPPEASSSELEPPRPAPLLEVVLGSLVVEPVLDVVVSALVVALDVPVFDAVGCVPLPDVSDPVDWAVPSVLVDVVELWVPVAELLSSVTGPLATDVASGLLHATSSDRVPMNSDALDHCRPEKRGDVRSTVA